MRIIRCRQYNITISYYIANNLKLKMHNLKVQNEKRQRFGSAAQDASMDSVIISK